MKGVSKKKQKKSTTKPTTKPKTKIHTGIVVDSLDQFQIYVLQEDNKIIPFGTPISESSARALAEGLRDVGIGGYILKLDGTPDGEKVEKWVGVDAVVAAKQEENALHQK